MNRDLHAAVVLSALLCCAACDRERRDLRGVPNGEQVVQTARLTDLQPGAPSSPPSIANPFAGNAYALSEGKRLYSEFNCVGCHAHGGGAIGPALMDHRWIYGARPEQIYSTIVQGRPNGMPAFGDRITQHQLWQLVAYVQSLSGNVPKAAAPGRSDDMAAGRPEMRRESRPPVQTGHR
jgi:cytochrome c oxidase cbb3-type subunit 3